MTSKRKQIETYPLFQVKEKSLGGWEVLRDGQYFADTGNRLDAIRITMAMDEIYRKKRVTDKNEMYTSALNDLDAWSHQMDASDTLLMVALRDKISELRTKYGSVPDYPVTPKSK
jgi:hypothetical protein